MTDKKNVIQKVVLGGVVANNGKILIIQRNKDEDIYPNLWELPSGKKEELEDVQDSLLREVKEEVGLDVEIVVPIDVFNYQIEKPDVIKDSTQINYLVKPVGNNSQVVLSEEHQAFDWVNANDLSKYNLSDPTKKTIIKAFDLLQKHKNFMSF